MSRYSWMRDAVDLTGDPPVVGGAEPSVAEVAVRGLPSLGSRMRSLVVVRESNEYDEVLMRGLVQHTLAYCSGLRSVEMARQIELLPLTAPGQLPPGVTAIPLVFGRARAVLFEIDGEYYLYSMSSAARSNKSGDNDFSRLLVAVLVALRPHDVYAASLSRLVRAFEHSALVLHAVSRHVDRVHAGSTVLTMNGEGAETGQIMWSTLAMVAASERNLIVQRLTAGVVAKYRRGEWIKGAGAVLLGYLLDPVTKNLRVDPARRDDVRRLWTLLADADIPAWAVVHHLADMGFSTATATKRHGPAATVADLRAPDTLVQQLLRWAPVYLTGKHTTRWANPFRGAPHIAGLPVHGATEDDPGHLLMAYDWGRVDVDPALIHAALNARKLKQPTGAAAKTLIAPLNETGWVQDGLEYMLTGSTADTYEIRIRGEAEPS